MRILIILAFAALALTACDDFLNKGDGQGATGTDTGTEDKPYLVPIEWAETNVGASTPEGYGSYFSFEQAEKACPKGWRLPTRYEFNALVDDENMSGEWGGVGYEFTDLTTGDKLFFPATGSYNPAGATTYGILLDFFRPIDGFCLVRVIFPGRLSRV